MIPDSIKKHRPTCTEVRERNGAYYVYRYSSVWDPVKKRAKKKTGACIGKITEKDGFIPSPRTQSVEVTTVIVKEYGCYHMFHSLNEEMYSTLRKYFPSNYREIFAISIIRLLNRATNRTIKNYYNASYLSEEIKGLYLSENTITKFMRSLGEQREQMIEFMREFISHGETLLFDGTCFFSNSNNATYTRKGYNPRKRQARQINVLYVFDRNNRSPVYYRLLPGNIVDKAAVEATFREANIKNCVVIGDKGCYSKKITGFMDGEGITYIYPLQVNTKYVREEFRKQPGYEKYDDAFVYHGRTIWFKKQEVGANGKHVYIFQDSGVKIEKENRYMEKYSSGADGYTLEEFHEKQKDYGMQFLYSNIDAGAEEIYLAYKTRWELEEMFDYLKNCLNLGRVSQQSNEAMEAWAFLNHICMMMFYRLCKSMMDAKLVDQYTPEDLMGLAKNISKVRINDKWYLSEISKSDSDLFKRIAVEFEQ